MHTYPFKSKSRKDYKKLREGQDYIVWIKPGTDIENMVSDISSPIVEIGGPTSSGYYFLDKLSLPSKPLITNIKSNPTAMDSEDPASYVDQVIDGRKLPYESSSIGIFLMSGMPITHDWYLDLPDTERDKAGDQIEKEYDVARLELEQVALGMLNPSKVTCAQRIPIYIEVHKALVPTGLFMTDGSLEEIICLQKIGFEIVAFTQEHIRPEQGWDGIYYEVVARKIGS